MWGGRAPPWAPSVRGVARCGSTHTNKTITANDQRWGAQRLPGFFSSTAFSKRPTETVRTDTLTRTDTATFDPAELIDPARELEEAAPLEILKWAADRYGSRLTFATGFGAEGCVLIDLIGRHQLPIDMFTLDTGLLFPETYDLWQRLESRYGVTIRRVSPEQTVEEQAAAHGPELWTREPDLCCAKRKVSPLESQLAGVDAWITAIRRDQTAARANTLVVEMDAKFGLEKVNPLVRWTKKDTWRHLLRHDVPYNPLHLSLIHI